MSLAGTRLGPYEIVSLLGAGGMGDVYRARDAKLGRDVAIKVLPASFAADPDHLARFEREARLLASLNHPNIGAIYGLEESARVTALVLELVEGETLAERLRRPGARGLRLGDALAIARQIADALDAAHERGIVHRDLKPANIMLTPDGTVKVLDFGLAKTRNEPNASLAGERDLTQSPTELSPTAHGVLLGTAPYMSPEQARGKVVDKRTDIWAFGCVLYEMLTGRRAFAGETTTDTLAAILERDAEWEKLPAAVPRRVRELLQRCLQKDPRHRLRDIGDARLGVADLSDAAGVSSERSSARQRGWRAATLAALAAAVLLVGYAILLSRESVGADFTFRPIAAQAAEERSPSWSPDGRSLAYVADIKGLPQVLVASLTSPVPQQVTSAANGCSNPFWSPDGTRLFFNADGDLWSVGAAGGTPVAAVKDAGIAAIAPDGTIAFLRGAGGNRTLWLLPKGRAVPAQYVADPFPRLFTQSSSIEFSRDGSKLAVLLQLQDDTGYRHQLWLLPFPSGAPRMMPDHDQLGPDRGFGVRRLSWEPDNRHVVVADADAGHGMHLFRLDTDRGSREPITSSVAEEENPAVSPDGRHIAFASGNIDFDILELMPNSNRVRPLLATGRAERYPVWFTEAGRFAYITDMRGSSEIWLRSDGEEWPTPIVVSGAGASPTWLALERPALSPDARRIAFGAISRDRHGIWIAPVAGGVPVPLDDRSVDQHGPSWSPDGNWLAYQRLTGNRWNLVKRPLGPGTPVDLADSLPGASDTVWSPTGEWIAFAGSGGLRLVSPDGKENKVISRTPAAAFDFAADGREIYAMRRGSDRTWELATINVRTATETITRLDISRTAIVSGLSARARGRGIAVAIGTSRFDVWLLDGYGVPARWFRWPVR